MGQDQKRTTPHEPGGRTPAGPAAASRARGRGGSWSAAAPCRFGSLRLASLALLWLCSLLWTGCSTPIAVVPARPFRAPADTLAFTNQTVWEYRVDPATGRQLHVRRPAAPDYALHCFAMARLTKEFHLHARFVPDAPAPDPAVLRARVHEVVARGPRRGDADDRRVEIPGYPDLWTLSQARGDLLRAEAGGAWRSYLQRGNWRMVLPFTRGQRRREAGRLADELGRGQVAVVHLVTFPALTLNHGVLLHGVRATETGWAYTLADPNAPGVEGELIYDRNTGRFRLPPTAYFAGGDVEAYEVYRDWAH